MSSTTERIIANARLLFEDIVRQHEETASSAGEINDHEIFGVTITSLTDRKVACLVLRGPEATVVWGQPAPTEHEALENLLRLTRAMFTLRDEPADGPGPKR